MQYRRQKNQRGFGTVEILLAVFAIIAIVGVGWLAYQQNRTEVSDATNGNGQPSAAQNEQPDRTQKPASSKTFTSATGGFSFKYPEGWTVTSQPPTSGDADEYIYITSPSNVASSSVNKLLITLIVSDNPDVRVGKTSRGTIEELSNGLRLWTTDSEHAQYSVSTGTVTCPELAMVSDDGTHFSHPMPNGKNLALVAGYCIGERTTTTLSYQAQVNSADWRKLVDIISSIKFN